MKKYLAALLFVIVAISIVSAAGVIETSRAGAFTAYVSYDSQIAFYPPSTAHAAPGQAVILAGYLSGPQYVNGRYVGLQGLKDKPVDICYKKGNKWEKLTSARTYSTGNPGYFRTTYHFQPGQTVQLMARFNGDNGWHASKSAATYTVWCKWGTKLTIARAGKAATLKPGQMYTVMGKLTDQQGRTVPNQWIGLYAVAKGATFHVDHNGWISGGTKWGRVQTVSDGTYQSPLRQVSESESAYASYGGDATHWGTTSPLPLLSVRVQ